MCTSFQGAGASRRFEEPECVRAEQHPPTGHHALPGVVTGLGHIVRTRGVALARRMAVGEHRHDGKARVAAACGVDEVVLVHADGSVAKEEMAVAVVAAQVMARKGRWVEQLVCGVAWGARGVQLWGWVGGRVGWRGVQGNVGWRQDNGTLLPEESRGAVPWGLRACTSGTHTEHRVWNEADAAA